MRVGADSLLTCGRNQPSYAYVSRGRNTVTVVSPGLEGRSLPLDDWLRARQRVTDVDAQTQRARKILRVGDRLDIKTFADRMGVCR